MDDKDQTPLLQPSEYGTSLKADYSAINSPLYNTFPVYRERDVINEKELASYDSVLPPEVPSEKTTKLYKRRWYILLLYSLMCGSEGLVWNTWSPISDSVQKAFGWNNGDISLLANWGPITYLTMPFFAWMIDTKGLRWSVLISMFCVTLGAGIRCIPTPQPSTIHKWLMNIGQILNGFGGPVACGAMPSVSATWFPPNERATATAIPVVFNYLSIAGAFLLGPLLVPDVSKQNVTYPNLTTVSDDSDTGQNNSNITGVTVLDLREDIALYLQVETGITAFVFLLLLVYFPKKPPTPPCISASVQREPFIQGVKLLLRNGNFWIMTLISLLINGFGNAWMAVLSLVLIPVGASQKEAGWIGFYSLLSVCAIMLIIGRVGDLFSRHMKWYIFIMFIIAAAMYLWFALITVKVLPFSTVFLYISVIIGQTANFGPHSLIFELGCDIAYPVGEGTTSGVLMGAPLTATIVFLFVMMIPNIDTMWLTWGLLAAMVVSTVLVVIVKEKHHRLEIDVQVEPDSRKQ